MVARRGRSRRGCRRTSPGALGERHQPVDVRGEQAQRLTGGAAQLRDAVVQVHGEDVVRGQLRHVGHQRRRGGDQHVRVDGAQRLGEFEVGEPVEGGFPLGAHQLAGRGREASVRGAQVGVAVHRALGAPLVHEVADADGFAREERLVLRPEDAEDAHLVLLGQQLGERHGGDLGPADRVGRSQQKGDFHSGLRWVRRSGCGGLGRLDGSAGRWRGRVRSLRGTGLPRRTDELEGAAAGVLRLDLDERAVLRPDRELGRSEHLAGGPQVVAVAADLQRLAAARSGHDPQRPGLAGGGVQQPAQRQGHAPGGRVRGQRFGGVAQHRPALLLDQFHDRRRGAVAGRVRAVDGEQDAGTGEGAVDAQYLRPGHGRCDGQPEPAGRGEAEAVAAAGADTGVQRARRAAVGGRAVADELEADGRRGAGVELQAQGPAAEGDRYSADVLAEQHGRLDGRLAVALAVQPGRGPYSGAAADEQDVRPRGASPSGPEASGPATGTPAGSRARRFRVWPSSTAAYWTRAAEPCAAGIRTESTRVLRPLARPAAARRRTEAPTFIAGLRRSAMPADFLITLSAWRGAVTAGPPAARRRHVAELGSRVLRAQRVPGRRDLEVHPSRVTGSPGSACWPHGAGGALLCQCTHACAPHARRRGPIHSRGPGPTT